MKLYNQLESIISNTKEGKEKINISELADIFGITSETLRKYEKQKILTPYREDNSYRSYSSWELTKLVRTRQLRNEGFSIREIDQQFEKVQLQSTIKKIEQKESEILQEIKEKERILEWLKERKEDIVKAQSIGDEIVISPQEQIYCCVYMADKTMVHKQGEELSHLKEWMSSLPYLNVYYVGVVGNEKVLSCVGITESQRKRYGLEHLVPDFTIPALTCALVNIMTYKSSTINTSNDDIKKSIDRIQKLKKECHPVFIIKMIEYTQKDETYACLNQTMIPLKND